MPSESRPDHPERHLAEEIETVSLLDDPVRRRVYFCVPPAPSYADRYHVASDLNITLNLAAFHLDKLAERGLLDFTYRRVSGRTGRGAGRPRKLYQRPIEDKAAVSLPQRDYRLIAKLFASALDSAGRRAHKKLAAVAHEQGTRLGKYALAASAATKSRRRRLAAVLDTLVAFGYDPHKEGKNIYLRNCPFHSLVRDHRDLVCGANQALMTGLIDTLKSAELKADYEPGEGRCCVVLRLIGQRDR